MAELTATAPKWEIPKGPFHAHFDCFSGAAGDMMLAAVLDASDGNSLLPYIQFCIESGLPELKGEFALEIKRVWRSKTGSIAANYLVVKSRYKHAAAPVPQPTHSHEHSPTVVGTGTGTSTISNADVNEEHSHDHRHEHGHGHSHDQSQEHTHAHTHEHEHEHEHEHKSLGDSSQPFDVKIGHSHGHEHEHEHTHGHTHRHDIHDDKQETEHDHVVDQDKGKKSHDHAHTHEHSHHHSHLHDHSHDDSKGPLRNLPEIREMLFDADTKFIPEWVKLKSIAAFTELAKAEAATHGAETVDDVHFHEVGAIDSIVDTVGTLLALHCLGVKTVSCSRLPLGEGTVWTEHGLLPVPAPATLRLLVNMPTCPGPPGITGELVTPTAAALLKVLATTVGRIEGRSPCFTIRRIGVGAGTKDFIKHPNVLRVMIGDEVAIPEVVK